jgi:uncharacterized protein YdhG (YjbR/CyaY superfamily)
MRKSKTRKRGTTGKRKDGSRAVEEYLANVPEPARSTLNKVRAAIRSAVPRETTEVLSYGIPSFKYKVVLMWYAGFSEHCSLFPTASVIEMFKTELEGYRISKGTIQFPIDKPLPAALVREMVKARVADVEKGKR